MVAGASIPADGQPAADLAAGSIRTDILEGRMAPGQQLVEVELVERLGVSRNTLREAFRQLCREGLAVHHRHRGVSVRTVTAADVTEIFTIRRTLELQALGSSNPYVPPPLLAAMDGVVTACDEAAVRGDWRGVGTASLRFHGLIVRLIGSPQIDVFFQTILAQLRLTFAIHPDEEAFQRPWVAEDRGLLTLLQHGEQAAARDTLALYLDESERRLLRLF